MSKDEMNQAEVTGNTAGVSPVEGYQDPIATAEQKPEKKQSTGAVIASTAGTVLLYKLFGIIGAAICFGGFWGIMAIAKSKLPTAAKVILGVLVGIACIVLLGLFILLSAALTS